MPVNISELSDTFKTITGKNAVTEEKKGKYETRVRKTNQSIGELNANIKFKHLSV